MRAPPKTFAHARRLRREMTPPEVLLWQALRGNALNGVRVRRQHSFGAYVLDFYIPSAKLVVEVDGAAHDVASIASKDERRDEWLVAQNVRILRFRAAEVLDRERRQDVLATIVAALDRAD